MVEFCQHQFGFDKPNVLWASCVRKFDNKFVTVETNIVFIIQFLMPKSVLFVNWVSMRRVVNVDVMSFSVLSCVSSV